MTETVSGASKTAGGSNRQLRRRRILTGKVWLTDHNASGLSRHELLKTLSTHGTGCHSQKR